MEQVYVRGSQVKLMILPDFLKQSPAFKKVATSKKKYDEKMAASGNRAFKGKRKKKL